MGRSVNQFSNQVTMNDAYHDIGTMLRPGQNDSRIVILNNDIDEHSVFSIIAQLLVLSKESSVKPINMIVSTYGGNVDDMFSLYDTIRNLPCPVRTLALGKVMSAGVLILSAGEKGKRRIGKSARIMMHSVSSQVYGNVFEMSNSIEEFQNQQKNLVSALATETKMDVDFINEVMQSKLDRFISPTEAVKLGIVDSII